VRSFLALLAAAGGLAASGAVPAHATESKPAPALVAEVCSKCHGEEGKGQSSLFPRLAGQQAAYIERQLLAFRGRERGDAHARSFMWGVAGPLSDAQIHDLAVHLSARPTVERTPSDDPTLAARGKLIFDQGIPSRGVPACADCHGKDAMGVEEVPRLARQYKEYLYRQILDFRSRMRRNEIMRDNLKNVTDEEALALAEYLSSK